jgi:hypothetical protein
MMRLEKLLIMCYIAVLQQGLPVYRWYAVSVKTKTATHPHMNGGKRLFAVDATSPGDTSPSIWRWDYGHADKRLS